MANSPLEKKKPSKNREPGALWANREPRTNTFSIHNSQFPIANLNARHLTGLTRCPDVVMHSGTLSSFCCSFFRSASEKTNNSCTGKDHAAVHPELASPEAPLSRSKGVSKGRRAGRAAF